MARAKVVAFVALMGALGNALFVLSQSVFTIGQVALDLSHVATFISAIFGGPLLGGVVGVLVGLGTGLYFGFIGGSLGLLGLIGLPVGKALTGVTAGFLSRALSNNASPSSRRTFLVVLVSYVPECIFMVFFFLVLVPTFLSPDVAAFLVPLLTPILAKAWIEIAFMAFLMGALAGNKGFVDFVRGFLA
ncbi:MAG TPA: hypothetical protein ENF78_00420 [Candidatus Bathyarchaeota archaeon]|nr:hypothetical protein [Candidatus Bathyarchaeota archaeon]